jgi:cytochrome b
MSYEAAEPRANITSRFNLLLVLVAVHVAAILYWLFRRGNLIGPW